MKAHRATQAQGERLHVPETSLTFLLSSLIPLHFAVCTFLLLLSLFLRRRVHSVLE